MTAATPDDLAPAYDAALPKDAPGAWIRAAIDRMFTPGQVDADRQRMIDEEEDWA